jgi:hypothetical protein
MRYLANIMHKTIPSFIIGLLLLLSFTGCIDVIERVSIAPGRSATLSITYIFDLRAVRGLVGDETSDPAKLNAELGDSLKTEFESRKKQLQKVASFKDIKMNNSFSDSSIVFTVESSLGNYKDIPKAHDILFDREGENSNDFPIRILVGKTDIHGWESIEFLSAGVPLGSGHGKSEEDFVKELREKNYTYSISAPNIQARMGSGKRISDNAIEWKAPITDLIIGKKNAVTGGVFFTLE